MGRAYLDGHLIADDFYYGRPWEIGLKRLAPQILEKGLVLKFLPLCKESPIYIAPEHLPDFSEAREVLLVRSIQAAVEYEQVVESPLS